MPQPGRKIVEKPAESRTVCVRIHFDSPEQVELIKWAAARRGIGFNAFVRWICIGAAKKIMAAPPEDLIGRFVEAAIRSDQPAA
jgi:hypothetical protein